MGNLKVCISLEKRNEAIENILEFITNEFGGFDITSNFVIKLLEDTIQNVEQKSLDIPLKYLK